MASSAGAGSEERAATQTSILIASYGEERWREVALERAVPSAERQGAHEVIVVHLPNGDVAAARNEAAAQATGEWLCFLDADDELAYGYLVQMARAERLNRRASERCLYTPAVSYIQNGRRRAARIHPQVDLLSGNWLVIGTLVHRSLFEEVGGFRLWPHGLEDWDLWARIWLRGDIEIVKVPRAIYVAHWNENSKHHELARNKRAYLAWYDRVAASHRKLAAEGSRT